MDFFVCVYVPDILQFISLKLLSDSLTRFDNERVLSLIVLSDSLSYVFCKAKNFMNVLQISIVILIIIQYLKKQ